MKTETELMAAFEAGTLTPEDEDRFLIGDDFSDTADPLPAATDEEAGEEPEVKAEPEQKEEVKEPVVLAKDGVHTIPYSRIEELQEGLKSSKEEAAQLKQALEEHKGLLEKLTVAQKADDKAGTTEKVDELVMDLAEEFPAAAKMIADMQKQLAAIAERDAQKAQEEQNQTAAEKAREDFDNAVTEIEPTYHTVSAMPEFWAWFDQQSPMVQAAGQSPDPRVVADLIKTFNDSQKTPVSDTTKDVEKKVKEALEKANTKSTVQTLSDIPGGTNPAADAIEAFHRLPESAQLAKLMAMSESERNRFMDRIV